MTTPELAVFRSPFFMFSFFAVTAVAILFFSDAGFSPPEFFVAFHCSYRSSLEWWQGRTKSLVFFLRCTDSARRNPPDGFINTSIYGGDFAASLSLGADSAKSGVSAQERLFRTGVKSRCGAGGELSGFILRHKFNHSFWHVHYVIYFRAECNLFGGNYGGLGKMVPSRRIEPSKSFRW